MPFNSRSSTANPAVYPATPSAAASYSASPFGSGTTQSAGTLQYCAKPPSWETPNS
jgi:hypothetical protein